MRGPKLVQAKKESSFVSLADVAPTFLELAGISTQCSFSGQSLVPFLHGKQPSQWRDDMGTQCNGTELYFTQRYIKTKTWKLVYNPLGCDELYDLQKDPHEIINRANDPTCAVIKQEMFRRLWRFAEKENDNHPINQYITVGLALHGPQEAFAL